MAEHRELNPVSHLTVGTVGEPGNRTFYLQGSQGSQIISLVIEKQQAAMMAASFESLLIDLNSKHPEETRTGAEPIWSDMRLREPIEPSFRVGHMGLGYNEDSDQVVLIAYELVEEEEEPNIVSFWTSRPQVKELIKHAATVVSSGRPICGNCGQPMDAEGHFCPNRNGHIH